MAKENVYTHNKLLRVRDRAVAALTLNLMLIVFVIGCLFHFFTKTGEVSLAGLTSLRYFTTLSGMLSALGSAVTTLYILRWLRTYKAMPKWATVMKYTCISSSSVTFFVIMVVFVYTKIFGTSVAHGELGAERILSGTNLFLHLICPLVGMISLILEPDADLKNVSVLLCFVPVVVYACIYDIFALGHGEKGWGDLYNIRAIGILPAAIIVTVVTITVGWVNLRIQHKFRADIEVEDSQIN